MGREGEVPEILEAPAGSDVLQVPAEEVMGSPAPAGLPSARTLLKVDSALATLSDGVFFAGVATAVAVLLSLWGAYTRDSYLGTILWFWLAGGASILLFLVCLHPSWIVREFRREFPTYIRSTTRRSPTFAIGVLAVLAVGNMVTPFAIRAAFPLVPAPLDIEIYNGMEAPAEVRIVVWDSANKTIFAESYLMDAQSNVSTGAIANGRGQYGVNVTVNGTRSAIGGFRVGLDYFSPTILIANDTIEFMQPVE